MNMPLLFWYESGILDTQDALYPRILVGLSLTQRDCFFLLNIYTSSTTNATASLKAVQRTLTKPDRVSAVIAWRLPCHNYVSGRYMNLTSKDMVILPIIY
jgi:hypothetical protein